MGDLSIDFFSSVSHLEPRCPKCNIKIEYGVTTEWDDKAEAHKCKECGTVLK